MSNLNQAGVVHREICDRKGCCVEDSIQLSDFGKYIDKFPNDSVATAHLIWSCVDGIFWRH